MCHAICTIGLHKLTYVSYPKQGITIQTWALDPINKPKMRQMILKDTAMMQAKRRNNIKIINHFINVIMN